ncbi:AAA ATPase central domain protein [Caldicellulosiruptor hydrothermalis 108]|uniref:AAA ATPase central domain protein n=2 Tax=Caldicellulosiruptor TaxID=44000 RepID=E4QBK1_CALH1|nr:AAA ATPase central domain protein [Caldicellulosiruptor hydrothermalis 108]
MSTRMHHSPLFDLDQAAQREEVCPVCGSKLWTEVEIFGVIRKLPCACECQKQEYEKQQQLQEAREKTLRLERLRSFSLMDKKFESCTFENFKIDSENEQFYRLAKNYCEQFEEMKKQNVGLLFYGPPGTGKTFLAFCIANYLIERFYPVIAVSMIGFLAKLKQLYSLSSGEMEIEVLNNFKNADLIVLDDLGAESSTGWAVEKLYMLVDMRYRDEKPLIVTTNYGLEELKEKLGIRIFDRLIEMCCPVEIGGTSRRLKSAYQKAQVVNKLLGE